MTNTPTPEDEFDANATYKEIVYRDDWQKHRPETYHDYRQAWNDIPQHKRVLDFPMHLDIETTNYCNLECPMCPRTVMVQQGEFGEIGRMTREHYASIIDQGVEHGLKSIKLNYLGEPLVHKDVIWQVEYAKKKGILDVMINSNATALTDKVARGLLEAGLDALFISFDAISPDLYEQQRVGTTIGTVIDNVYNFIKLRNEGYPHVHVRISMVMFNEPEWKAQFEGLQTMWKNVVDAVGYGFYTERDPNERNEYPEQEGFWCSQPYQRMFLKYNGNVTVCCVDDKDEMVVGNWHQDKLYDIWNNAEYKRIRDLHGSGRYYDLDLCRKCYMPVSD